MNRKLLRYAGLALYGAQWQRPMAQALRVHQTTIMRWWRGEYNLPANLGDRIAELLWQRMLRLDKVRDAIKSPADPDSLLADGGLVGGDDAAPSPPARRVRGKRSSRTHDDDTKDGEKDQAHRDSPLV